MKLIYCPKCEDVVALFPLKRRTCLCGRSSGYYQDDGETAIIEGEAIPLGIANESFQSALKIRPKEGVLGECFTAFVIPEDCLTVIKRYRSIYEVPADE